MDDSALRWTGRAGARLRKEVLARLRQGRSLSSLGLGEVDGRVDLRGLRLDERTELRDATLAGLDLSRATLDRVNLWHCVISDCRFDEASGEQFKTWACEVTDTSFQGAHLPHAVLAGWVEGRVTRFTRTSFAGANLDRASLGARHTDCDFSGARLAHAKFDGAWLVRCTFAGLLYLAMIEPRKLSWPVTEPGTIVETDFSRVLFWRTVLGGVDFGEILLPPDPDLVVLPEAATVARVRAALPADTPDDTTGPDWWLGVIERGLTEQGGGWLLDLRGEPAEPLKYLPFYLHALREAGVAVADGAGGGLVGRTAEELRNLGMTLERARQLRSHIEEDRERDYAMADRINASDEERALIPRRFVAPLAVADRLLETLRAAEPS